MEVTITSYPMEFFIIDAFFVKLFYISESYMTGPQNWVFVQHWFHARPTDTQTFLFVIAEMHNYMAML